jgi:hypothetical protein
MFVLVAMVSCMPHLRMVHNKYVYSRLCQDIQEPIAPWWVSQKVMLLSVGLGLNPRSAGYYG